MSGTVYKDSKMKSTGAKDAYAAVKNEGTKVTGSGAGGKVTVNDLDPELYDIVYNSGGKSAAQNITIGGTDYSTKVGTGNAGYLTDNPDFYVGDTSVNINVEGMDDSQAMSAIIAAINGLYSRLAVLEGTDTAASLSYFPVPTGTYAREESYDVPKVFNFSNNGAAPSLGWYGHIMRLKQRQRSLIVARYYISGTLPANNGEGYICGNPIGYTIESLGVTGMSGNISVGPIDPALIVNHAVTKEYTQGSYDYRQYTVPGPPDDVEVTIDYLPTYYNSVPTWDKGQFVPRIINKTSSDINLKGREVLITLIGSGDNLMYWDSTSLSTVYQDSNGYYWGHVHGSDMSHADGCLVTVGANGTTSGSDIS